jgi:hypothetical protein
MVKKVKTCNDSYYVNITRNIFEIIHAIKMSKFQALGVNTRS